MGRQPDFIKSILVKIFFRSYRRKMRAKEPYGEEKGFFGLMKSLQLLNRCMRNNAVRLFCVGATIGQVIQREPSGANLYQFVNFVINTIRVVGCITGCGSY